MHVRSLFRLGAALLVSLAATAHAAAADAPAAPAASPHTIGVAKLNVGDLDQTRAFYESMFGFKEVGRYGAANVYDEPILGFDSGARLALFHSLTDAPVPKPQAPQVLIYTPDFDALVQRIEAARYPIQRLSVSQSGPFKVAIARDPSGNAVEIFARENQEIAIGGSKLIVDDREKAEEFFTKVFDVKPLRRFKTPVYDEVLLGFGDGPWLALFEPKNEEALPKSRFPLVAIYTTQFDAVLERIKELGYGYREVATSRPDLRIVIAKDPAGNAIEIIRR